MKSTPKNQNNPLVIRLRLAPSPTGFLHIGNLRTALFGYLLTKSWQGKFILRIEDTDQKREVTGAAEKLIDVLKKVGLKFDEGPHIGGEYGPYIQSQRQKIYDKYQEQLLKEGKAYRCFCTPKRLAQMRQDQEKRHEAPHYDGHCRSISPEESKKRAQNGETFVIRQLMPLTGSVVVHDELRGDISFKAETLDDQILIKSDGVPTYQFANVIDDHLMAISHVTRGEEWIPSFPKNVLLYQAFGWNIPKFIHLPLILNKVGGGKLSKRQGDVFVEDFLAKGYLPEAIINFCALLGWHSKDDQEIWSLSELEKSFSLEGMGVSPAVFDLEKLDYFNGYYIRQKSLTNLTDLCLPYLKTANRDISQRDRIESFVSLAQDRLKKISDIVEATDFLFKLPNYEPQLLLWKALSERQTKHNLEELEKELQDVEETNWHKEYLEKRILTWIKNHSYKNGEYLWPLRVALTGLKNSPGPFEVAGALGRTDSFNRLKKAISLL